MKKVSFAAKRPTNTATNPVDAWVENRDAIPQTPVPREPMKRLTIDVSKDLHKRIKSQCAMENLVMADEIRALLEHRFPPAIAPDQEHGQGATS
jgi:hypothetical protein